MTKHLGRILGLCAGWLAVWPAWTWASPPELEALRRERSALRAEIARHDERYHRDAAPEISDYEYDQRKARLRELERILAGEAAEGLPVPEIGDDRTGRFPSAAHRERMLSLEKTYTEAALRAFHGRLAKALGHDDLAYVVEPKYDGLAISVTYENGLLRRAVTRGNGAVGEEISANLSLLKHLPRELRRATPDGGEVKVPEMVELRGEIYVTNDEFRRLNAEREAAGEPPYAHPRSLAAGTIRQLAPRPDELRRLDVVFYGLGACLPSSARPTSQRALSTELQRWGLPAVDDIRPARGLEELSSAVQAMGGARSEWKYPTDGVVVKLDDVTEQQAVGVTENAPRWAIAFKFAPERAETRVEAITVQVGRTGVLTPMAELAPVVLGGSRITRATLHNRDELARKDVRVGDTVVVEKAGEIVPAVVAVNLGRRPPTDVPFDFPSQCPACHRAVVTRPLEAAVRCPNEACPARQQRRLEYFASKEGLDFPGLGPATIEALVASGRLQQPADFFRLRREDFAAVGKPIGAVLERLLAAIEARRRTELWHVVAALGIPQIGAVNAREVARRWPSLELLAAAEPAGDDPVSRALARHFAEPEHRAEIAGLRAAGVTPTSPSEQTSGALAGKTVVLTGTLPNLTRTEAVTRIEAAGAHVAGSVSRQTNYVIAGRDPGAKAAAARKLGIPVIDEAEMLRLIEGRNEPPALGRRE